MRGRLRVAFLVAFLGLACVLAACGGGGGGGAPPPPIEVTNLDATGPGSLAAAIDAALPGTTITFAPGMTGTLDLSGGALVIDKRLTIAGRAGDAITLTGGDAARVLEVTAAGELTLSDLAIVEGSATSGGGIYNEGMLTLTDVTVADCHATGTGRGGGLANDGGVVTCTDCSFVLCTAYNGGGFANDRGSTTLRRCSIYGNATTGNSGAGGLNSDGTLVAVNCTFSNNQATGLDRVGGGLIISSDEFGSQTTLICCTFAENSATGPGGGIFAQAETSPPTPSVVRLEGCIVAGNFAGSGGQDLDLIEPQVVLSVALNNVIGVDTNSTIVNGVQGNLVGTAGLPLDPLLGALDANGGPTLTHLPAAGSVARDHVPDDDCLDETGVALTLDQRGMPRPVGSDCDAGSVESP